MHHIFDNEAENKILKFWKYRLWMADISVSVLV